MLIVLYAYKDATIGENEQRLHVLAAWHEAPLFRQGESTLMVRISYKISETGAPDNV